jgi:hypothetical protein
MAQTLTILEAIMKPLQTILLSHLLAQANQTSRDLHQHTVSRKRMDGKIWSWLSL